MGTGGRRRRLSTTALAVFLIAGCGTTADILGPVGDGGHVGVVLPMLTSPFWQSYNDYVPELAAEQDVDVLPTVNSAGDPAQQITDINNLLNQGVAGLVVAPLDSAAIVAGLNQAQRRGVPVVAVDVAPEDGEVVMVVRADNRAYGDQACRYLGEEIGAGKVVQIQGDLSSVNGRERSEAFHDCMARRHPDIEVFDIPANWDGETAAAQLDGLLTAEPDIAGVYLQAGGVYLAPALQTLRGRGMLHERGHADHIVIVSNDGIPQELDAIRRGEIDATLSQPADGYAGTALSYLKAAMAGETFAPGPTAHGSEIVELPNGLLEDQLPTPLVDIDNVEDPALWGNTVG
ncbi:MULTISPECIES: sugar ABC transporter substrate-binding protein [Actinoalloteichus]|uniref:ABC-type sugar transport system, periplasmic component n=1 Tax=Actinoalloteichus fjordicus TaxID=1612552 RepID=A0AAC9LF84_9PSEU|nr:MULTISPECIES: sugar ABC transporter substrate-binding protein [Actinoalloteichus]APU15677.1 ABC-type sugar transport system, periplasmic component [Actinoalloteichus fjordicus]APU21737.1 ABC-type sugar transport system, periplasmic component [Actinoalloteichus sp. GBA129-24]